MRLCLHQLRAEQLLFWRNREAAIFVFLFPPLLFVLLASVFGGTGDGDPAASCSPACSATASRTRPLAASRSRS